jgi:uncharacterized protein YyaL (SSP411 family)
MRFGTTRAICRRQKKIQSYLQNFYTVTADRIWLQRAEQAAQFISANFKNEVGYVTSAKNGALKSNPQVDENADLVRFSNLLHHYTGKTGYQEIAQHAMQYLSVPGTADGRGFLVGGILLADQEIAAPPRHITIVGRKDDTAARALFRAALQILPRTNGLSGGTNATARCPIMTSSTPYWNKRLLLSAEIRAALRRFFRRRS